MLEEYVRRVSREQLLTEEERRKLSEENRRAAAQRFAPLYRLPAEQKSASLPEPADKPERFEDIREGNAHTVSVRTRMEMTASNRNAAYAARPAEPVGREPEPAAYHAPADDAYDAESQRAHERRRMSEENRRAAQETVTVRQYAARMPRHRVPTDEELIAELRAKKEAEQAQAESARIARMQASADNFRSAFGLGAQYAPAWPHGGGYAYVSGSSAVAVVPEDQPEEETEQERQEDAAAENAPQSLPERTPEEGSIHAAGGGRLSVSRRGRLYPKRMNTVRTVLFGAVAVALFGVVIYGRVQTNEIYTEIAELQAQYDDIVARNVSMRSEMEGKMTVKNIEEYATGVLGLKKLDQSQIQYIQIQTDDEVTITEPESNWLVTINDYLSEIWNFFTRR